MRFKKSGQNGGLFYLKVKYNIHCISYCKYSIQYLTKLFLFHSSNDETMSRKNIRNKTKRYYNSLFTIMKNKLLTLTALAALSINAAFANSLSVGYGSNLFSRGELLAKDSVQFAADYTHTNALGGTLAFDIVSAHNTRSYEGATLFHGGVEGQLTDMFFAFGKIRVLDDIDSEMSRDLIFGAQWSLPFNPKVTLAQNLIRDGNSFELALSHDVTIQGVDLLFSAQGGDTDLRRVDNVAYYSIGATASKELIKGVTGSLSVDQVDSDVIDRECIVAAQISVSF